MNEERKALFEMRYNNSLFDLMYFSFLKKVNADNVILEKTTINDKNERSTETITLFPKRTE